MEPLKPSKLAIAERIATGASVLIWVGVLLMAVGLTLTYLELRSEQQAVAEAEALSFVVVATATPTASPTVRASPTAANTSTPTCTSPPPTPTLDYIATFVWPEDPQALLRARKRMPTVWLSPSAKPVLNPVEGLRTSAHDRARTPTVMPTSTPTTTPLPTPTPGGVVPASAPPDRIVIPAINLDAPVVPIGWHIEEQGGYKVSVWDSPDNAAGWHETSAYPGDPGNVVLNGHNNIRGEVFRYLIDLDSEARVLLYVGDAIYYYSVSEKHLLKERGEPPGVRYQNAQWIAPTGDERLTLVTCWPYTSNTHRLIVVAEPYRPDHLSP